MIKNNQGIRPPGKTVDMSGRPPLKYWIKLATTRKRCVVIVFGFLKSGYGFPMVEYIEVNYA